MTRFAQQRPGTPIPSLARERSNAPERPVGTDLAAGRSLFHRSDPHGLVTERLEELGSIRSGQAWTCPRCGKRKLYVTPARDYAGAVVVHCQKCDHGRARREPSLVLETLRLTLRDLFPQDMPPRTYGNRVNDYVERAQGYVSVPIGPRPDVAELEREFAEGHRKPVPVELGAMPEDATRRAPLPPREEVRPLAPVTVEAMRAAADQRDATLISVLAYAGPRPGEALGLRWSDMRERTLLIERAISLGEFGDTKNHKKRTVRLLAPLAQDLREWRLASGRPRDRELVFPGRDGRPWTEAAYQSWRRRAFKRALDAAGVEYARPYDLRHTFASLLAHERRSAIYIARQLGHTARLSVDTYQHVLDELEDAPGQDAEAAILAARSISVAPQLPKAGG